jgi:hypothetical protein
MLFLLYINDITNEIYKPIQSGIFADDVAVWTSIYTCDEKEMETQIDLLQRSLDNVCLWASRWKLLLAPDKTQSITFRHKNKKKFPKMDLKLNSTQIQEAEYVKYLGLIIDSKMTFQQHINYIYGKTARKLGYLTFLCSYKGIRPSMSVYNLLYKTIIRPSLEYASAFWNAAAADCHKRKLERIQRIALCRILGVMNSTAYETVNVISQIPPLELRRQQEEVKLYQKCVRLSKKLPDHNLIQGYNLWKRYHEIKTNEHFCWSGKLSTLSRGCILEAELGIPPITPDDKPYQNKLPMQAELLPQSIKSPFPKWSEPTPEQILNTFDDKTIAIFVDGSTKPDPGLGGVGLVIQDPTTPRWIELEYPIVGLTTTLGCEIEAIRQGIEYVIQNNADARVVILSDSKFAVNSILNNYSNNLGKEMFLKYIG